MPESLPEPGEPIDEDDAPGFLVQLDDTEAFINLATMVRAEQSSSRSTFIIYLANGLYSQGVDSSSDTLRKRVETVLDLALTTVSSLTESFASDIPPSVSEDAKDKLDTEILNAGVKAMEVTSTEDDEKVRLPNHSLYASTT